MSKTFTWEEIAKHNTEQSCWVVIDGNVYDVTEFLGEHPGGKKVILRQAGTDATKQFTNLHSSDVLPKYGPKYLIGTASGGVSAAGASASAQLRSFTEEEIAAHSTEKSCYIVIDGLVYDVTGFLADHPGGKKVLLGVGGKDATKQFVSLHAPSVLDKYGPGLLVGKVAEKPAALVPSKSAIFGRGVPYGDPAWYHGWHNPYYNESHLRLRQGLREWVTREVVPFVDEWDENRSMSKEIFRKAAQAHVLPAVIGPPWPVEYVGSEVIGGVKGEEYDSFHELIFTDELANAGSGGVVWGMLGGLSIGLPPLMHFGSKFLKDKVVAPCLNGEKFICLAITEPYAGSDVANLQTTAKKTEDERHYIVNGEKKWITNGVFADYFTVAVRTGGEGMGGVSLLLIEREFPGVTTRQMKCQGVWPSGTAYITFEDVKVPAENLIGKENHGFKYIMNNFNHERWSICAQVSRLSRVCYEESFIYAHKRKTFGKRLIDHAVIRFKLAQMARQVEAYHAWLEYVTYQLKMMSKEEANEKLGGAIALMKAHGTQMLEFCAREASQIFGGLAYTRAGQGGKIERIYREVRAYSIPGGSEEIMLDLGMRQAMKQFGRL